MKYRYYKSGPDTKTVLFAVLAVLFFVASAYELVAIQNKDQSIQILNGQINVANDVLNTTQAALQTEHAVNSQLHSQLSADDAAIQSLSGKLGYAQDQISSLTPIVKRFAAVGVRSDGTGVVIPVEVKLVGGEGTISVNIKNVDLQSGVQASIRTAASVAESFTGTSLKDKDVTVSFINSGTGIASLDGDSAGAVITTTIIAAIQNKTARADVLMTGTINNDGTIGVVGGVANKAQAAKDYGASLFLVPLGQRVTIAGLNVAEVGSVQEAVNAILR